MPVQHLPVETEFKTVVKQNIGNPRVLEVNTFA